MGYKGGRLSDLVPSEAHTRRTVRAVARRGGEAMTDLTKDATPVEHGATCESFFTSPVKREAQPGGTADTSGVRSHY